MIPIKSFHDRAHFRGIDRRTTLKATHNQGG